MTVGEDGRRLAGPPGFTLLELLLALSILSIILVVILGALRVTVRAWEKGEGAVSVQQRSRTVLDQMDRQLSSAVVLSRSQEDEPLVRFAGTETSVEFISSLSLTSRTVSAPVHVLYLLEPEPEGGKRLLLYEDRIESGDRLAKGPLTLEAAPFVLAEGLDELSFEYLEGGSHGVGLSWVSAWPPPAGPDMPRAVGITARHEEGGHTVRVIARIHAWQRPEPEP